MMDAGSREIFFGGGFHLVGLCFFSFVGFKKLKELWRGPIRKKMGPGKPRTRVKKKNRGRYGGLWGNCGTTGCFWTR